MKPVFNFHQSAVIPYRIKNLNNAQNNSSTNKNVLFTEKELEILLITSLKKKKWIIPKGFIEDQLTPYESAKKEAYEEAGVLGRDHFIELGSFRIKKSSGILDVVVYSMEVFQILEDYPEAKERKRKWFLYDEAIKNVSIPEVQDFIKTLQNNLNNFS